MGRKIETTVTYLSMTERHVYHVPVPKGQIALLRAHDIPVHFYRYLYDVVGRDYVWVFRKQMSDEELSGVLASPDTEVYVLYLDGVPAGFAELDLSQPDTVDLAYFGLVPDFVGRKLGPYFLHQVIGLMWGHRRTTLTVNTCTLDHPRALATYQKAGFEAVRRETRRL